MSALQADRHLSELRDVGYTILRDAIEPRLLERLRDTILRLETQVAKNEPAGLRGFNKTVRVRTLLRRDPVFQEALLYPPVLALAEAVLGPDCLLQVASTLTISPGDGAQPLHTDDMYTALPRPHPSLVCNTIWAIGDFTDENGATRLVPGSHLWPATPAESLAAAMANPLDHSSIAAAMPRGSILVFDGALWHGGGANNSSAPRTGLAVSYCAGWMRQQENFQLSVPPALAATFPPRLQELCGFGTFQGLIGNIEGRRPADVLFGDEVQAFADAL